MSTIGGIGLKEIARDAIRFHNQAFELKDTTELLPESGLFAFRKDGEKHAWNPEVIAKLQIATRLGDYKRFKGLYTSG